MLRNEKFKLTLFIEIICILMYRFIDLNLDSMSNPFFWGAIVFGVYTYYLIMGYFCRSCNKNQIMKGFFSYRLPTKTCWNCNEKVT